MWRQRPTSRWCSHKARNVENYHTLPASKREAQNRLWVTGLRENHACRCLHPVLPASRPVLCLYHHFKQHTASSIEEALNKCLENDWVQNTWPYNSFCTRVLSQAFTRQRELRTLITHSTPSGEFLLQLLLTVSKSGLFDFLATNHLFSFQLLIFRWAVPSLALAYPFPPHWPLSALNFQAQPQVPCIPVAALMGRRGHEAWPCEWDRPAAEEIFPGWELGGRTDVDPCFVFLVFNHQRRGLVLGSRMNYTRFITVKSVTRKPYSIRVMCESKLRPSPPEWKWRGGTHTAAPGWVNLALCRLDTEVRLK